ncbi:APC family permease [Ferrimicrobium sp.]|uniref:APC family permease n=1 Tax=Ferrimicrobium sp. TaxID=2926050 RepID=UPI00261C7869|nr:APC family permease [Ferrimicrobium sp.]
MSPDLGPPGTSSEFKRSLSLTGVTVNGMALIAPGAFLWTTFQEQAAQTNHGSATGSQMWTGLLFAFVLAMFTAWSYSQLAKIYPNAGTGSTYYFAEAAFLDKKSELHRRLARPAKLAFGWISHLYYWIYPGIMIAFIATIVGYIWSDLDHGNQLGWPVLSLIAIVSSALVGYVAYRGITGSTMVALGINVVQIVTLVAISAIFIVYRISYPHAGYVQPNAGGVLLPHDFINLLYQSTIAILLLVGFESITSLGAEAMKPERDIQRGVLIALAIQGGFCYLLEYFSSDFVLGKATMAGVHGAPYAAAGNDSAPIGTLVTNVVNRLFGGGGEVVALVVAFTVLLALLGTTLACMNTAVRLSYSMARDKELPSLLGILHGRFATPAAGVWILAGVSALIGIYGVHTVDNLTQITLASNIGTFLVYGITCAITLVAFASRHDKHLIKHRIVPALGLLMNIVELAGVVYLAIAGGGSGATDAIKAIIIVAVWVVAGFVWVLVNPKRTHAKTIHEERLRSAVS